MSGTDLVYEFDVQEDKEYVPRDLYVIGMNHDDKIRNVAKIVEVFVRLKCTAAVIRCCVNAVSIEPVDSTSLLSSVKHGSVGAFVLFGIADPTKLVQQTGRPTIHNALKKLIEKLLDCQMALSGHSSPYPKNDRLSTYKFKLARGLEVSVNWCYRHECWFGYFQDPDKRFRLFGDMRKNFF